MLSICLVGKPNVGKSTLFNKLALRRYKSIVHNTPGVTRDYKEVIINSDEFKYNLIDTAGLYLGAKASNFEKKINLLTQEAIKKASLVWFIVDFKTGLDKRDIAIAKFLRRTGKHIILIINKCDNKDKYSTIDEFYNLGFKSIFKISAEHSIGIFELLQASYEIFGQSKCAQQKEPTATAEEQIIKIAVVGRPNAGKSTIINALTGTNRMLTGPEPGLTRDVVGTRFAYKSHQIEILDTAGLRKKRKVEDEVESLSTRASIACIKDADIALLILDIGHLLENQDFKIANLALDAGKPLILVVNKTDTVSAESLSTIKREFLLDLKSKLSQAKDAKVLFVSAINNVDVGQILSAAVKQFGMIGSEIKTFKLNQWLRDAIEQNHPPMDSLGKKLKIKYITQISSNPMVFKAFMNKPSALPASYISYLTSSLQETFHLKGLPVKIMLAKSHNPYAERK